MHRPLLAGLAAAALVAPGVAYASRTVSGTIFVDKDGDGLLSAGDEVFTDGVVFWETTPDAPIGKLGTYSLTAPDQAGIVWVLGHHGLDPGPFWADVPAGGDRTIDIPVRPLSVLGDLIFVIASDTHAGIFGMPVADQAFVLQQATSIEPRPHFIAITGDITQSNKPEQFTTVLDAISRIDTPYVPVPGNHDWYDGGAAYRQNFGPPTYSFNAGALHFMVLNDADSLESRERFVERDISLLTDSAAIVALMHAPPRDELVEWLAGHGVETLLTGHMHSNRVLVHDTLVEYNTEPLAMGGMDLTPAGYRVFTADQDGTLHCVHRTIVNQPVLRILSPAADQVVPACRVPVLAALEAGASVVSIEVRAAGLDSVPLAPAGGWVHASEPLRICEPGRHQIEVQAHLAGGETLVDTVEVEIGEPPPVRAIQDWPMFQGSPGHLGLSTVEAGFPLRTQWVAAVGGHVQDGSPVVAGGRVFVSVSDFADGKAGGVVALDAITGERLWERRVGFSVRNAPAVAGGVVVFAANDGTVHAASAATGEPRWTYSIAPAAEPTSRNIYSAPVIADGVVYVGARRELVAIEVDTGELIWSVIPIDSWGDLASHAVPAVAMGRLVLAFDRGEEGLMAFDTANGDRVWQTGPEVTQGMQGSAVIVDDTVYVVNELTDVTAIQLGNGNSRWTRRLDERAFDWGYKAVATPAYHDGTLFVGTQFGQLFALDADSGQTMWTHDAESSIIRTSHYRGEIPSFGAAPAITPRLVWTGTPDGVLRALSEHHGRELWSLSLGVPITASPVPAGGLMFVASYDGSVRAFAPQPKVELPRSGGCSAGGQGGFEGAATILACLLFGGFALRATGTASRTARSGGCMSRR